MKRIRQMEAGYLDSMCQEIRDSAGKLQHAPDYSAAGGNPRAGNSRLIGNAASLGSSQIGNFSRYESRLRSASYRALAAIRGTPEGLFPTGDYPGPEIP
ncbi:MAG: hypothetical protein R2729_21045 [Bryobacteraceae bacterium]